jgi:hypothetical protein
VVREEYEGQNPVPEDDVPVDNGMLRDVDEKRSQLVCVASVAVLEDETERDMFALLRASSAI